MLSNLGLAEMKKTLLSLIVGAAVILPVFAFEWEKLEPVPGVTVFADFDSVKKEEHGTIFNIMVNDPALAAYRQLQVLTDCSNSAPNLKLIASDKNLVFEPETIAALHNFACKTSQERKSSSSFESSYQSVSVNISSDAPNTAAFQQFISLMSEKIREKWFYEKNINNASATVKFSVDNKGQASNIAITKTSSNLQFDQSLVRAVAQASPFGNIPTNFTGRPINVTYTLNASQSANLTSYITSLQKKVNNNWAPEKMTEAQSVELDFLVNADGSVSDLKIVKSTENKEFNKFALDAVNNSAPFDIFPASFNQEPLKMKFVFEYNPMTGYSVVSSYGARSDVQ